MINWGLIGTVLGIALTLGLIKLGWGLIGDFFKSIRSEETKKKLGDGIRTANRYAVYKVTEKIEKRRQEKQKNKDGDPPIIGYIR